MDGVVCISDGNIGSGLMTPMQAMKKKTYVTWRRFFIYLLGGKCTRCNAVENLEIDHIIPVENNAMSGAGRDARLTDWKEQYMKNNLQLLCKEHNLDKREFKKNGGEKMDELSFEGLLASMDERVSEKTQSMYAVVRCKETESTFSVFDTKIIEKLRGKEGNKITIKYKKSADGKYNNVSNIFFENENQKETLGTLIKETCREVSNISVEVDKILSNLNKMHACLPKE